MKQSPRDKNLERILRGSKLVAGGFMGTDPRHPLEVIQADAASLEKMGMTAQQIAGRMRELTDLARPRLGNTIEIEGKYEVRSEDYKGMLVCPWPHAGRYEKQITTCRRLDTGEKIAWTDLNIHLIEAHGFFEGHGSVFRLEPEVLVRILFK